MPDVFIITVEFRKWHQLVPRCAWIEQDAREQHQIILRRLGYQRVYTTGRGTIAAEILYECEGDGPAIVLQMKYGDLPDDAPSSS